MPVNETVAAAVITAELLSIDYGGPLTPAATALINNLGESFAKCIGHYASQNMVSTDITGVLAGATPSTPGVFTGTGTGGVSGLVKGDALSGTGLGGDIMAVLESGNYGGPLDGVSRSQLADLANAVATFADYVNSNATVATVDTGVGLVNNINNPNATGTGTGSGN